MDNLSLCESGGNESSSKYPNSTSFSGIENLGCGKENNSMTANVSVGSERQLGSTSLIIEPVNSFPQMETGLKYKLGSGNASSKRSAQHVPETGTHRAGKRHVRWKNVARLFAAKKQKWRSPPVRYKYYFNLLCLWSFTKYQLTRGLICLVNHGRAT